MPEQPVRDHEDVRRDCARKLRFVETSGTFTAIVGALLGEDWSTPTFAELQLLPAYLLGRRVDGESALKVFPGADEDLIRSINGVAVVAGLDRDELSFLLGRVNELRTV